MKKQIPILFSTSMVQAVYPREAKSQTRRTRGLERINERPDDWLFDRFETNIKGGLNAVFKRKEEFSLDPDWNESFPCPYGQPGDILYVRENWQLHGWDFEDGEAYIKYAAGAVETVYYEDDWDEPNNWVLRQIDRLETEGVIVMNHDQERFDFTDKKQTFRPNIHLPKWCSRIWLEVTDIRVERLQDISEADAEAEGLAKVTKDGNLWKYGIPDSDGYPGTDENGWPWHEWDKDPRAAFLKLWAKINGEESLKANPWVWVVEFSILSTTGKPNL